MKHYFSYNQKEYNCFNFEYKLKQRLIHFYYSLFPRYGRYFFLYDTTDSVLVEHINHSLESFKRAIAEDYCNSFTLFNSLKDMDIEPDHLRVYSLPRPLQNDNEMSILYRQQDRKVGIEAQNIVSSVQRINETVREYMQEHILTSTKDRILSECMKEGRLSLPRFIARKGISLDVETFYNLSKQSKEQYVETVSKDLLIQKSIEELIINHQSLDVLRKEVKEIYSNTNYYDVSKKDKQLSYNEEIHIGTKDGKSTGHIEHERFFKKDSKSIHYDNASFRTTKAHKQSLKEDVLFNDLLLTKEIKTTQDNSLMTGEVRLYKTPSKDMGVKKDILLKKKASQQFNIEQIERVQKTAQSEIDIAKDMLLKDFSNQLKVHNDVLLGAGDKTIDVHEERRISKSHKKARIQEEIKRLDTVNKNLQVEIDKRLNLHKRFWFIKEHGPIDYLLLPNEDYQYPMQIETMVSKPNYSYLYEYSNEYKSLNSPLIIELYDNDYNIICEAYQPFIYDGTFQFRDILLTIKTEGNKVDYRLEIQNENLAYCIIRQPLDINGYPVLYTTTEKFLSQNHPIPFGNDLGCKEIPVPIPIMVDFINVLLLMWSKFFRAFNGYTGKQAIYGLLNVVHEWVTLDTSLQEDTIEYYHRCYRWLRWEAEKLYLKARYDMNINGNAWIELLIGELIEYMELHHMNEVPVFNPIDKMDEMRDLVSDPSFDIEVVLTKVKGVRHRIIEKLNRKKTF